MSRPRILIVDDEQHIVSLVSMTLRRSGYAVLTADNGPRALELADAFDVALMVVDHSMPGMTGSELSKKVSGRFPVLMVTAKPELTEEERQYAAGVMNKPFSPIELADRVEQIVGPGQPSKEQSA